MIGNYFFGTRVSLLIQNIVGALKVDFENNFFLITLRKRILNRDNYYFVTLFLLCCNKKKEIQDSI